MGIFSDVTGSYGFVWGFTVALSWWWMFFFLQNGVNNVFLLNINICCISTLFIYSLALNVGTVLCRFLSDLSNFFRNHLPFFEAFVQKISIWTVSIS